MCAREKYNVKTTLSNPDHISQGGFPKPTMQTHDPYADFIEAELKKVDEKLAHIEHYLAGKPQYDAEAVTGEKWSMFGNAAGAPPAPSTALKVVNPARRDHHIEMIKALRVGASHASLSVKTGNSFFQSSRQRWIFRTALAGALIAFIIFAIWVALLIRRVIYFH